MSLNSHGNQRHEHQCPHFIDDPKAKAQRGLVILAIPKLGLPHCAKLSSFISFIISLFSRSVWKYLLMLNYLTETCLKCNCKTRILNWFVDGKGEGGSYRCERTEYACPAVGLAPQSWYGISSVEMWCFQKSNLLKSTAPEPHLWRVGS